MTAKAFQRKLRAAEKALIGCEPHWQELIATYGKCQLMPSSRTPFEYLMRGIISQQLSSKAASTIVGRVELMLGEQGFTPKSIDATEHQALRDCGLSNAKANYCRGIAEAELTGQICLADLQDLNSEQAIEQLVKLKGVGVWTAQMFCIFALGHLDIFAPDDVGLQRGMQYLYKLPEKPNKQQMAQITQIWSPYRSVASWYLWQIADAT